MISFPLLLAAVVSAAPVGVDLSQSLSWRFIGPYRGGRVTTVAGVPGQPLVYYQGATGGGVFKTEDAGLSWHNVSDGFFRTGSVGAIAVAPSDPNVLYVGMGEACIRNNFSHGDGVYRSDDAGKTWRHLGLDDSRQIGQIRVHPENPDVVYVAALGHVFGPNEERGVFRSVDGGATFERVLFVDENTGAVDLAMDPKSPDVLYAAMWQVRRFPWGIVERGPGSGVYRSSDGGVTWQELTEGLPSADKGRIGVSVSPVDPNRVWALVDAEGGGLFLSEDAGRSFRLVNDDFHLRRRPYYYSHVYADTKDVETVYVLTSPFMKSTDGGKTFAFIQVPHGDNHALWIAPEDNQRLVNGNDGGANVSFDGGESWSTIYNQPTAQFYWVTTDDRFPYRVYGAQQDNSTMSIASRTSGSGITERDWHPVGGGESGYIAPHPEEPDIVYAGSYWGLMTRYEHRTGETRNVAPWPEMPLGRTGDELKYRFNWSFPILVSVHEPHPIYVGANVVFRSETEGQSWEVVSDDLTRNDESKMHLGKLSDFYGTLITIAESKLARGQLWVGSDDGLVHLTRDSGRSWENVTPAELEPWSRVNLIEASPHDAGTAYLAVNRHHLDDYRPYIYRTTDFGKSWDVLGDGIAEGAFVRSVREDPEKRGILYAGTETGVYVSLDDGASFHSLQLELPAVPVTDLAVADGDLVVSTQGRGFWILDDLTPLRALKDTTLGSEPVLFPPRPAVRMGRSGSGRPRAGEGENPPAGVVIDYYLPSAVSPHQDVTLELRDAAGNSIGTFRGEELDAREGLNRFVWDMRYPDGRGIAGRRTYLFGGSLRGPLAVPGSYEVRLVASGTSSSAPVRIEKDPRLDATDEDYQEQFDTLIRIRDAVSSAHDAANVLISLRDALDDVAREARSSTENASLASELEELRERADSVLNELVELRFTGIDDQMLVFPLKLNAAISSLQRAVASADRSPTAQVHAALEERTRELAAELDRLEAIRSELPALNERLRARGLAPLAIDGPEGEARR